MRTPPTKKNRHASSPPSSFASVNPGPCFGRLDSALAFPRKSYQYLIIGAKRHVDNIVSPRILMRFPKIEVRNFVALVSAIALLNGCATSWVAEKAYGHLPTDSQSKIVGESVPEPAWYLLLPVAVPFDVATSPVQGFAILCMYFHWFGAEGL
jgi:hypothetical protein